MRAQLTLALTGETLTLRLSPPKRPKGWLSRLRTLAYRHSDPSSTPPVRAAADSALALPIQQLSETLELAWGALVKQSPQDLNAVDFYVQLGLAYTRLGLLHQPAESSQTESRPAVIDRYVHAWILQMWGMDPATQIVRWSRVVGGNDILISCIDRLVFVELENFAKRHDLRFVSCKPAVLSELELPASSTESSATLRTLVWTEPSATVQRAPQVQLLHCVGSQVQALWRGWIPAPENADAPDDALHGAIRRFAATSAVNLDTQLVFRHWDQPLQQPAPIGAGK